MPYDDWLSDEVDHVRQPDRLLSRVGTEGEWRIGGDVLREPLIDVTGLWISPENQLDTAQRLSCVTD